MRIDLEDFENSTAFAHYGTFGVGLFSVDPDDDGYPLTVGDYSGNAGMPTCVCLSMCVYIGVCLCVFSLLVVCIPVKLHDVVRLHLG